MPPPPRAALGLRVIRAALGLLRLGATLATWEDQHLRMDAIHHVTPPRVRRWLNGARAPRDG